MRRREDWEARLAAEIEHADSLPFRWGVSDCCLFAANCVVEMTGADPATGLRWAYMNKKGAAKAAALLIGHRPRRGLAREVAEWFAAKFQTPEIRPALAQRGDMCLVTEGFEQPTLGIIDTTGRRVACKGADGIVLMPLSAVERAWRIPH